MPGLEQLAALLLERRNGRCINTIARQHHLAPKTYRLIECGKSRPQIRTCYRLAGFLEVAPTDILQLAGYDIPELDQLPIRQRHETVPNS